jgi:hypothetical protein
MSIDHGSAASSERRSNAFFGDYFTKSNRSEIFAERRGRLALGRPAEGGNRPWD